MIFIVVFIDDDSVSHIARLVPLHSRRGDVYQKHLPAFLVDPLPAPQKGDRLEYPPPRPLEGRQCILARRRTGNIEFQREERQDSPRFCSGCLPSGGERRGGEPEVLPLQTRYALKELKDYTEKGGGGGE